MNPSPELLKQVEREHQEILNAPPIHYGPTIPRCGFCGAIVASHEHLIPVDGAVHSESHNQLHATHDDRVPGMQRFKGPCCG